MKRFKHLFTLVLALGILGTSFVYAQPTDNPNYSYRGPIITLPYEYGGLTFTFYMNPGETKCDKFTLTNDFQPNADGTSRSIKYYTMASDFEIDNATGIPTFPKESLYIDKDFSLARWITFQNDSVTVEKWSQTKDVYFCVVAPANAAPGSYYAALLLSTITKEQYLENEKINQDTNGASIGSRLGPNIIVTISGAKQENLYLDGMKVVDLENNEHFLNIFEYPDLKIQTTVKNDGNVIFKPSGNIFIHQGDLGKVESKLIFNEDGRRIFPYSNRLIENTWQPESFLANKLNKEGKSEFTFNPSKIPNLKMGRYTATLQMTYLDSGGNFQRANDYSVAFWVIPWRIILAIIVLVLILVAIYIYKRKTTIKYVQTVNAKRNKAKNSK